MFGCLLTMTSSPIAGRDTDRARVGPKDRRDSAGPDGDLEAVVFLPLTGLSGTVLSAV